MGAFLLTIHSRGISFEVFIIPLNVPLKPKILMHKLFKPLALLLTLLPSSLWAATIVTVSSGGDNSQYMNSFMAQQFRTDANSYSNLTFTLGLANYAATSQGSFSVGLYRADDGNVPGTTIGILGTANTSFFTNGNRINSFNLNPSDFQHISFTNNALTLAANTSYWVEVSNDIDQNFTWDSFTPDPVKTGVGTYGFAYVGTPTANPNTVFDLTVTGTAVPEPSTYALFGLGALALIVAYRRRNGCKATAGPAKVA